MKPVEEMTREEIEIERDALATEKAERDAWLASNPAFTATALAELMSNGHVVIDEKPEDVKVEDSKDEKSEEPAPEPWPHDVIEYEGLRLEIRRPDASALLAVSLLATSGAALSKQMQIFGIFFTKHFSAASLATVLESMTDPDSPVSLDGLLVALSDSPSA